MFGEINKKTKIRDKKYTSIDQLNDYIKEQEENFGKIKVKKSSTERHDKILRALKNLKITIEKDRISKEQAFENLKRSNKIMRKTIMKLREEMKTCRNDIFEYQKLDDLNTDRLLQVDPLSHIGPIR